MKRSLLAVTLVATLASSAQEVTWNPEHEDRQLKPKEIKSIDKALPQQPIVEAKAERKLLVYSATAGYRHKCIPVALVALEKLGEASGAYDATLSDDLANFESENLKTFDAVLMLNSTGDIFMPNQKQRKKFTDEEWQWLQSRHERLIANLVSFVEEGGGLAGIHAATDACKGDHNYTETIGGVFDGHPWTAKCNVTIEVTDPEHAINKPVFEAMKDFQIKDEIYQFAEGTATPEKLRILLNLDPERSDAPKKKPTRENDDYPVAWVQKVGKGRVFYSSLGHNNEVYWNPLVLKHYLAGIQFALGDLEAETEPSQKVQLPKVVE